MMFENPKNILQMKINEVLGSDEESIVSDLIKIILLKKAAKDQDNLVYTEMYNLLGLEKFTELIALLDGRTVEFPTKEEFKDTVTTVLCYYYHTIEGKDWSEIKTILSLPDMNTVRQGIRASRFEAYLKEVMNKRFK